MSEPSLEERIRKSSRIRHLMGQAIQTAVSHVLDIELSGEEARSLTASGSIREVIDRLEERMQVRRRGIKRRSLAPEVERELGVSEVVMEVGGLSQEERTQHVEKTIRRWERRFEEKQAADRTAEDIDEMMDKLKQRGYRFRRFVGRVENLRRQQLKRLKYFITDREQLPVAEKELNQVYDKYLKRATQVLGEA